MTSQKTNNNIIEELVESERDDCAVADVRRMVLRMFNELKEELKDNM
jgi:hypothetical protein